MWVPPEKVVPCYTYDSLCLTLKEEYRLSVFKKKMLSKSLGSKTEEETED